MPDNSSHPKDKSFKILSRSVVYDLGNIHNTHPVSVGISFQDAIAHDWRLGMRQWSLMPFGQYLQEIKRCDNVLLARRPDVVLPPLLVHLKYTKQCAAFEDYVRNICAPDEEVVFVWSKS